MGMTGNNHFDKLVEAGNPVGEVIAVNKFLITVRGLHPVNSRALVLFSDGSKGFVHHIYHDYVLVLYMGEQTMKVGTTVVVMMPQLSAKVGKEFIGRVINVLGEPLDGKGPISAEGDWPVFNPAPPIYARELLDKQVETGVTGIDTLFPIVRGQRMAILGDNKSGKTTVATQLMINQKQTDITVVYVLIGKRRTDVDELLTRLQEADALKTAIIIVATMFESLIMSYIAPYVGASMAEYFWQKCAMDSLIIYDDLTSHAQAYREVALVSSTSPGRDSYPGDMFYAHSSLLERAGKLKENHATLTSLPIVLTPGNDVTAYLPTNVMSITDGQWIMDMELFRDGHRPALSTGLSVTRVGGVGQTDRQHKHASKAMKALAAYRQAQEYAHFGSELALAAHKDLDRGKLIYDLLNQGPTETYNFMEQQLMFEIVLGVDEPSTVDMAALKKHVREIAPLVTEESQFDANREKLQALSIIELKGVPAGGQPAAAAPAADGAKPVEGAPADKDKEKAEAKA
jgi:F-type H+-transporting ATPase subunit alpha